jgi:hypothetical protein
MSKYSWDRDARRAGRWQVNPNLSPRLQTIVIYDIQDLLPLLIYFQDSEWKNPSNIKKNWRPHFENAIAWNYQIFQIPNTRKNICLHDANLQIIFDNQKYI